MNQSKRLHGLLIGTALGDSVGLPAEGLSPTSIARRGWSADWQQRLIFGKGMWSDDTEHTLILAQALNHSNGDPAQFQRLLARGMKQWFLFLPAGVGLATARAGIKLLLGCPANKSGVFSAGNGPCMRAALLGVVFHDDPGKRREFNRIQTRLTHTDPKAEYCSRAVVEIAALLSVASSPPSISELFEAITFSDADSDFRNLISTIRLSIENQTPLPELLRKLGGNPEKGVSGYCFQTLAAVLHCGINYHWEPGKALPAIWNAGGDTDTTGAILGALCGSLHGASSFPDRWKKNLSEWPCNIESFAELAEATMEHRPLIVRPSLHPFLIIRNLIFLLIVLSHGLLRIFLR